MPLSIKQIAVSKISSSKLRSEFDNEKIERAARSIVAAEGVINPLIVKRTGIKSYELVDGDFEFHAAARAKEINIARGENIAAYIIEEEDTESILKEQIEIFRKLKTIEPSTDSSLEKDRSNLENRLTNIESRTDSRFDELKEYIKKLEEKDAKLEKTLNERLPEKIPPLQIFNEASETELVQKLSPIVNSKKANNFVKQIIKVRKEQSFESLTEVVSKISGLGDKTMLKIVDRWLYSQ